MKNVDIYGNVLFLKTYLPQYNESNILVNSQKSDILNLLHQRAKS